MDARAQAYNRFQVGMADIRVSRHPLRKDIIVALHNTEHDIYMDVADSSEYARVFKQAIVRKNPDMAFVQEQFDILVEPEDILPFHVIFSRTGVPRPPMLDDRIIIEGTVYVISKLKPTNRELDALYECLVYPERDSRYINDPLALYYIRFRRGLEEVGFEGIYGAPVVMEVVYGGCPTQMSFDGATWQRFYQRSRVVVPEGATGLCIMDATQRCVSLGFGETASVSRILPVGAAAVAPVLKVSPPQLTFTTAGVPQAITFTAAPAPLLVFDSGVQVRQMGNISRVYPTQSNDYFIEFVLNAERAENGPSVGQYDVCVIDPKDERAESLVLPFKIQAGQKGKKITVRVEKTREPEPAGSAPVLPPEDNVIYR